MCIVDPAGFVEGDELIKKIYQVRPSVKVFILTCRKDADFVFSLYNIGIAGYVLKTSEAKVLYKALSVVLEDGQFIEPILIPALKDKIDRLESGSLSDDFALTKRERAILQYVAGGLYNKEIAFNLGIKEKTVKNHITSLFKKIGVKDRIQAAVFAVKNGYVNI
jgi:DNA-binding NarL/FixJ family response regulator